MLCIVSFIVQHRQVKYLGNQEVTTHLRLQLLLGNYYFFYNFLVLFQFHYFIHKFRLILLWRLRPRFTGGRLVYLVVGIFGAFVELDIHVFSINLLVQLIALLSPFNFLESGQFIFALDLGEVVQSEYIFGLFQRLGLVGLNLTVFLVDGLEYFGLFIVLLLQGPSNVYN